MSTFSLDLSNLKNPKSDNGQSAAAVTGVVISIIFVMYFIINANQQTGSSKVLNGFFVVGAISVMILAAGNFFTDSYRTTLNAVGLVVALMCFGYFVYQATMGDSAAGSNKVSLGFSATGSILLVGTFGYLAFKST